MRKDSGWFARALTEMPSHWLLLTSRSILLDKKGAVAFLSLEQASKYREAGALSIVLVRGNIMCFTLC